MPPKTSQTVPSAPPAASVIENKSLSSSSSSSTMEPVLSLLTNLSSLSQLPMTILNLIMEYGHTRSSMVLLVQDPNIPLTNRHNRDNATAKLEVVSLPPSCYIMLFNDPHFNDHLTTPSMSSSTSKDGGGGGGAVAYEWHRFQGLEGKSAYGSIIPAPEYGSCYYHSRYHPNDGVSHLDTSFLALSKRSDSLSMPKPPPPSWLPLDASLHGAKPSNHRLIRIDSNTTSYLMAISMYTERQVLTTQRLKDGVSHALLDLSSKNGWTKVRLYQGKRPNIVVVYNDSVYCWCTLAANFGGSSCYLPSSLPLSTSSSATPASLSSLNGWRSIAMPPLCKIDRPIVNNDDAHWSHAIALPSIHAILLLTIFNYKDDTEVACVYDTLNDSYRLLEWSIPFTSTFSQLLLDRSRQSDECQVAYLNGYLVIIGSERELNQFNHITNCYLLPIDSLLNTSKVGIMQLPERVGTTRWKCIRQAIPMPIRYSTSCVVSI
jgi:hypothetical protein